MGSKVTTVLSNPEKKTALQKNQSLQNSLLCTVLEFSGGGSVIKKVSLSSLFILFWILGHKWEYFKKTHENMV